MEGAKDCRPAQIAAQFVSRQDVVLSLPQSLPKLPAKTVFAFAGLHAFKVGLTLTYAQ